MNERIERTHQVVPYARPGAEQVPKTRVLVEAVDGGGIRFVDPPVARPWRWTPLAADMLVGTLVAFGVGALLGRILGMGTRPALWLASGFALARLWMTLIDLRRLMSSPTVVEVSGGFLRLLLPSKKQVAVPIKDVSSVRATRPRRWIPFHGRTSTLEVAARGRRYEMIACRDYVEVRWLAHQLRRACGMAEVDLSEPPLQLRRDAQDAPQPPVGDAVPPSAIVFPPGETRPGIAGRIYDRLLREYENMSCGAGCVFFPLLIVGGLLVWQGAAVCTICVAYGRGAYFRDHLRFVPHRSFLLTNGQTIAWWFVGLHFVLWACGMGLWVATWLVILGVAARVGGWLRRRT